MAFSSSPPSRPLDFLKHGPGVIEDIATQMREGVGLAEQFGGSAAVDEWPTVRGHGGRLRA